jgi:tubulin polyglutamylase TTLL6/13
LAKNLTRLQKFFKGEFDFFPKTWVLPGDAAELKQQFNKKKTKTFIIKPTNMCQGRGIYLTRRYEDIDLKSGD